MESPPENFNPFMLASQDEHGENSSQNSVNSMDLDSMRFNRSQRREGNKQVNQILSLDLMSPRTKFIYETFKNKPESPSANQKLEESYAFKQGNLIGEGEVIKDVFSCALQMKILVQGKLYVSNQALYFHSMFNDKLLIIGSSTKMKVPLSNIKDIVKSKNALIFDNSIDIKQKNGSKMFLTSFINRDICFRLILKMMKRLSYFEGKQLIKNKGVESTSSPPKSNQFKKNPGQGEVRTSNISSQPVQKTNHSVKQISLEIHDDGSHSEDVKEEEETSSSPKKMIDIDSLDIWKESKFQFSDSMANIENQRLAKAYEKIHKSQEWDWNLVDTQVNFPIKFVMANLYYSFKNKFQCLGDKSLCRHILEMHDNDPVQYEDKPEILAGNYNKALAYFMDREAKLPSESELETWPLEDQPFTVSFTHNIANPMPMCPKQTLHIEKHTDYYISPRKFIRYIENQGKEFQFCDNFQNHQFYILTQLDDGKTRVEIKGRCEILKKIMFLQSTVVSECEKGTRKMFDDIWLPNVPGFLQKMSEEFEIKEKDALKDQMSSSLKNSKKQKKSGGKREEQKQEESPATQSQVRGSKGD